MKSRFLFPHQWRLVGYLCFVLIIIFVVVLKVLHPEGYAAVDLHQLHPVRDVNTGVAAMRLHHDIIILLLIFGLLLIAFSKEKIEDEQIAQLRLDSLQWAIYLNYAIFIACVISIHGLYFIPIILFNIVTPLLFFIIRFRWKIYSLNRLLKNS